MKWKIILFMGMAAMISPVLANDIINITSDYEHFGYNEDSNKFINYDGLRYYPNSTGMLVRDQSGSTLVFLDFEMEGVVLMGSLGSAPPISWSYSNSTVYENGTVVDDSTKEPIISNVTYRYTKHSLVGSQTYGLVEVAHHFIFYPHKDMKLLTLVSSPVLINSFSFDYNLQTDRTYLGDFDNEYRFNGLNFDYEDLTETLVVTPTLSTANQTYSVRATTQTGTLTGLLSLDPSVTGWHYATTTGEYYNDWSNPTNAYASDDNRASVVGINNDQDYGNFSFESSIPSDATQITGIECELEAICSEWPPPMRAKICVLDIHITPTNFTNESAGAGDWRNTWTTSDPESWKSYGGATDLGGLDSSLFNVTNMRNMSFYSAIYQEKTTTTFGGPQVDTIRCKAYYSMPPPNIDLIDRSPSDNDTIGSTYYVNITTDLELDYAYLSTNQTGSWENHSMTELNASDWGIVMFGRDRGVDDGTDFTYFVSAMSTADAENATIERRLNVSSGLPTHTDELPANDTTDPSTVIRHNWTLTEPESDHTTMFLTQGIDADLFNYYWYSDTNYYTNYTFSINGSKPIVDINAYANNLIGYYKFDNISWFGANRTFEFDFASNSNATCQEVGNDCPTVSRLGGRHEGYWDFDGSDDYLTLEDNTEYKTLCHNGCSFAFNIEPDDGGYTEDTIIAMWDENDVTQQYFRIFKLSSTNPSFDRIKIEIGSGNGSTQCSMVGSTLSPKKKGYYVVTWNTSNSCYYVDGDQLDSGICDNCSLDFNKSSWENSDMSVLIGASNDSNSRTDLYDGEMDELSIFNYSLSFDEVMNLSKPHNGTHYWAIHTYQSPNDVKVDMWRYTIDEVLLGCDYDCTTNPTVSTSIDCDGGNATFIGTDRTTDTTTINPDINITNYQDIIIQQCRVIQMGGFYG